MPNGAARRCSNPAGRRAFLLGCGTALLAHTSVLRALAGAAPVPGTPTRPDVASLDHDRILAEAERYRTVKPVSITALHCPRSPGTAHDYYSEAEAQDGETLDPPAYTAHRDALFALGLQVPALVAAYVLTEDERFAAQATVLLRSWFTDPETRMTPRMDYGHVVRSAAASPKAGTFEGILETLPLVEIAQAIPFLAASPSFLATDRTGVVGWYAAYPRWLTEVQDSGPRLAALARDRKDHHGMSWLLQVSAFTLVTAPENGGARGESGAMADLRHRFKTTTLRAQVSSEGKFPHELSSETPYRNSLFNLDLMACTCDLLSTRFDNLWDYQLEDGPGMRAAIAYHFPYIAERSKWPFRADVSRFTELPGRRISLLLAARAYQRAEYAELWKALRPVADDAVIQRTTPGEQPLLWVRRPGRSTAARELFVPLPGGHRRAWFAGPISPAAEEEDAATGPALPGVKSQMAEYVAFKEAVAVDPDCDACAASTADHGSKWLHSVQT